MTGHATHGFGPYLVPLLVVLVVALRLVRNKPRKVKPNRLFVAPLILALAAATTLAQTPSPAWMWAGLYIVAAVAGAAVGYLSGRHREFTLDADSGHILARATPIGTMLFAVLFIIRFGLKYIVSGGNPYAPPDLNAHPAASTIGWTDAGLAFSTAMLLATAATTWWRTRHLLAQRRAQALQSGEGRRDGGAYRPART